MGLEEINGIAPDQGSKKLKTPISSKELLVNLSGGNCQHP